MKSCQIWGDMSADRAADQYPIVTVCDACTEQYTKSVEDEDPPIIAVVGGYDRSNGEECHFCDITAEEE